MPLADFIADILGETPVETPMHTPGQMNRAKLLVADLDGEEKDECEGFSSAISSAISSVFYNPSDAHGDAHDSLDLFIADILDEMPVQTSVHTPGQISAKLFAADLDGEEKDACAGFSDAISSVFYNPSDANDNVYEAAAAAALGFDAPGGLYAPFCADGANAAQIADAEAQYSDFDAAPSAVAGNNSIGQRCFNLGCGLNYGLHKPQQLLQEQLHFFSSTVQWQVQAQAQAQLEVSVAMAQQPLPLKTGRGGGPLQAQQLQHVQQMQELVSSFRKRQRTQSQSEAVGAHKQLIAQAQTQAQVRALPCV